MKCCFCDKKETIHHLFIDCPLAQLVLHIVHIAPPTSKTNLFGDWLHGVRKKDKVQIRVEAYALLWAIWKKMNDLNFYKSSASSYLQVIPMATY
jgi:hypothetical protein